MSNPLVHAERSAKKWGGTADDYLAVHRWFDATNAHLPDNRHRMVLHNGFGIALAEQVFGFGNHQLGTANESLYARSASSMCWRIWAAFRRWPSALKELPLRPWMAGARSSSSGSQSWMTARVHADATAVAGASNTLR